MQRLNRGLFAVTSLLCLACSAIWFSKYSSTEIFYFSRQPADGVLLGDNHGYAILASIAREVRDVAPVKFVDVHSGHSSFEAWRFLPTIDISVAPIRAPGVIGYRVAIPFWVDSARVRGKLLEAVRRCKFNGISDHRYENISREVAEEEAKKWREVELGRLIRN